MTTAAQVVKRMYAAALAYPGAYEDTPWGDRVAKVKGNQKIFMFCGVYQGRLSFTAKLPVSGAAALSLPFAKPTGYNLGKSGWVTASFEDPAEAPEGLLLEWLDESYRAVAPKKLVAQLEGAPAPAAPARSKKAPVKKRPAKKKPAKKKPAKKGPVR